VGIARVYANAKIINLELLQLKSSHSLQFLAKISFQRLGYCSRPHHLNISSSRLENSSGRVGKVDHKGEIEEVSNGG